MQELTIGNFTIRKLHNCLDRRSFPITPEFEFFFTDDMGKRSEVGLLEEVRIIFKGVEAVRIETRSVPTRESIAIPEEDKPLRKSDLDASLNKLGQEIAKALTHVMNEKPDGYSPGKLDNAMGA